MRGATLKATKRARVEFRVLGPLEVWRSGDLVEVGGARQRAVLARLLMAKQEVVPVDRLIDDLWDGEPSPSALGVLQAYVSNLRRCLEPERAPRASATMLVSRRPGYALTVRTDADAFASLITQGAAALADGEAPKAIVALDAALALWRGDPYLELGDKAWAQPEVARLRELFLVAQEHRHAAALALGQVHGSIPPLEQLVADHPLREGFWRLLVLALYRTQRQAEALEALRRARRHLADELGLDLSPALRELEQQILEQSPRLGESSSLMVSDGQDLRGTAPHVGRAPPVVGSDVLVGRDQALEEIWEAGEEVIRLGRPRSIAVVGPAGIGKSTLSEHVEAELRQRGWTTVSAHCQETSGAPALWPWLQILEELALVQPLPSEVHDLVTGESAPVAAPGPGDPASARFRQNENVRRYLVEAAGRSPLLLTIDDLQWADNASLQLLTDLFTRTRTAQILVLVATREDSDEAHATALTRLDRAGGRRIHLTGLRPEELRELAAASGHDIAGQALWDRTAGNPFFVRETLRLLGPGTGHGLTGVPDSVGDLLRRRISRLPEDVRSLLRDASVLGRRVDVEVLAAVSGATSDAAWDALGAGARTGVLADSADGAFCFAHDLVRETLYGDLAALRRSQLHVRAMEVLSHGMEADASRLARHAQSAGPAAGEAAVRWSIAAAEQAQARLGHADAARWWSCAVSAHTRYAAASPREHVELLLRLLRSQLDSGDAIGARETRNRAVVASETVDDLDLTGRTLVALDAPALWLLKGYDAVEPAAVARMDDVLGRRPEGDSELTCRLAATLAGELYDGTEDPRCLELSQTAVEMARRLDRPDVLAYALNMRHLATNRNQLEDHRLTIGPELVALGEQHHLAAFTLLGHQLLRDALLTRFDVAGSDHHARVADRIISRLDLALPRMQSVAHQAARRQLDGRFEDAAALHADFARLQNSWWVMDPLLAAIHAEHLLLAGRTAEIDPDALPLIATVMPTVAHDLGLLSAADTAGTLPASPDWTPPPRDWAWLTVMTVRADAAAELGSDAVRARTYDELLPYASRIALSAGHAAPVAWYLARLATALGDSSTAGRHLVALSEACRRESLDWWAARAHETALAIT